MKKNRLILAVAAVGLFGGAVSAQQQPAPGGGQQQPPEPMRFFVTSVGVGSGDLGGLEGADAHCQSLAAAAGAGDRTWRAYLSTQAVPGGEVVNARDRIGTGPWHNFNGVRIAANVADLHGDYERDRNYLFKDTALNETGGVVNGRGDEPNIHDILTGSDSLGRAFATGEDRTCQNWTNGTADSRGWVGHHDRSGGNTTSWNSAHATRGCDQPSLAASGGAGLFYCFAID